MGSNSSLQKFTFLNLNVWASNDVYVGNQFMCKNGDPCRSFIRAA